MDEGTIISSNHDKTVVIYKDYVLKLMKNKLAYINEIKARDIYKGREIPKIYEYGELVETFYIKMEKKEGETLNMSNINMSSSERSGLVEEILKFRERLADSLPKRDSIKYYERILDRCKPLEFVRKSLPTLCKNHPLVFCHGDLHPSNIIIKDGKISGIVDWEMSSFYPSSYEYCNRMEFYTPGLEYFNNSLIDKSIYNDIFAIDVALTKYERGEDIQPYIPIIRNICSS